MTESRRECRRESKKKRGERERGEGERATEKERGGLMQ